jgi:hypothetical protein
MGNILNHIFSFDSILMRHMKIIILSISLIAMLGTFAFSQNTLNNTGGASTSITRVICQVYNTVRNLIFLIGLVLVIVGGTIYALANFMGGSHKGSFQGYGMGMIIGGVLGVVIAVAAPYILNVVVSANPNGVLTATGVSGANGLCNSAGVVGSA